MRALAIPRSRARPDAATAEARLAPMLLAAGWASAIVAIGLQAALPALVGRYALWPLLIGIVVLGLPHGALDHLVPARLGWRWGRRPVGLGLYLAAYAGLAGAYLGLWMVQPGWAFVGFLLITVLHWGQGDQRFLEIFLQRRRGSGLDGLVTVLTRGALPIVVPIVAFPATVEDLFVRATSSLGVRVAIVPPSIPELRAALIGLLGLALACYLLVAVRTASSRSGLLVDVAELALLVGLFAYVPAYAAIGIYFLAWHALRHLARLLLLKPGDAEAVRTGDLTGPVRRLTVDLLPVTIVALALLAGLTAWSATNVRTLADFAAVYLVLISGLTVPHAVVVAMMDLAPRDDASDPPTVALCNPGMLERPARIDRQALSNRASR